MLLLVFAIHILTHFLPFTYSLIFFLFINSLFSSACLPDLSPIGHLLPIFCLPLPIFCYPLICHNTSFLSSLLVQFYLLPLLHLFLLIFLLLSLWLEIYTLAFLCFLCFSFRASSTLLVHLVFFLSPCFFVPRFSHFFSLSFACFYFILLHVVSTFFCFVILL